MCNFLIFKIDFRKRGGKREKNNDLLFHLLMRSLVDSCLCPDWELNLQSWLLGWHANQLSNPARAIHV